MKTLVKMVIAATSLAVATVAISRQAIAGAVLDRVLSNKKLVVAAGTDWPPLSFLNAKHELDGFDIEIAKGIATYLGVQIEFVTPGWDVISAGKWTGRWDMAMGQMAATKARAEKFSFPAVYFYARKIAAVHRDSKMTKLSDLGGKVVGVLAGTPESLYAKHELTPAWLGAQPVSFEFKPGEVKTYDSNLVALDDLRLGEGVRLDAVLISQTQLSSFQKKYPIKQLGDPLFSVADSIATMHGDTEFDEKIAAAMKIMRDDGTLSRLSLKWYGIDYTVEE